MFLSVVGQDSIRGFVMADGGLTSSQGNLSVRCYLIRWLSKIGFR